MITPPQEPANAAAIRRLIGAMPSARWLGFELSRLGEGEAELLLPYRADFGHMGLFPASVIGALADFAGGLAAATLLPAGWTNMTADVDLRVLRPARGAALVATGEIVHAGRGSSIAQAWVHAGDGADAVLCATALVGMRNVPPQTESLQ